MDIPDSLLLPNTNSMEYINEQNWILLCMPGDSEHSSCQHSHLSHEHSQTNFALYIVTTNSLHHHTQLSNCTHCKPFSTNYSSTSLYYYSSYRCHKQRIIHHNTNSTKTLAYPNWEHERIHLHHNRNYLKRIQELTTRTSPRIQDTLDQSSLIEFDSWTRV